ncbi:hypothetical protein GPECTOR_2g1092 [Gonium pectorale]|uniref:Protein kinase domain-containing protein n=1 Tax=Gonium pectorale TaxID=33097 RepID=A0A150H0L7_GONPE|nr:hypothetical protein GPECTOR_2g1092 [Gonium pectorale]|eukprot:KXZ55543.1 hypothetical protein GPECTOR_2g1092 [Gonium pectorale]
MQIAQQPQAGLFKPRPTPADGLLYLAPCARSSMWSPTRGARWSLEQYELVRELYQGYASTVYKAHCLTSNQTVVLKVYALDGLTDFLRHQVLRELDIHSRLKHPGVVQLLAAFREGEALALVLEYVRGGTLDVARRLLGGRMGEHRAAHLVVLPLLRALSYLHRMGVVHRDIKPDNLLFTPDWRLKLIDFGVALSLEEERAVTRAGSSQYMAPEVHACPLKRGPADNKVDEQLAYGAAADVWSLGAVVYEVLVGFTPFPAGAPPLVATPKTGSADGDGDAPAAVSAAEGDNSGPGEAADGDAGLPEAEVVAEGKGEGTAKAHASSGGAQVLAFPASVSPAARSFVSACLEPHPGDRPTVEQLMQHPWLQGAQQVGAA